MAPAQQRCYYEPLKEDLNADKENCLYRGGSLYFPRAISDLVINSDLGGSEIVLYDIDGICPIDRLEVEKVMATPSLILR